MILAYVCPSRQHMLPPPEQLNGRAYHDTTAASSWLQLSSRGSSLPGANRCLSHFPGCRHSLAVVGRRHWQCVVHCGTEDDVRDGVKTSRNSPPLTLPRPMQYCSVPSCFTAVLCDFQTHASYDFLHR